MSSLPNHLIGEQLPFEDTILADAWLRSFAALCRSQGLRDTSAQMQITDLFLTRAGLKAVAWATAEFRPRPIESVPFVEIKRHLVEALHKQQADLLTRRVATLTQQRQEPNETAREFAARLSMNASSITGGDGEKLGLIATLLAGLRDVAARDRLMERIRDPQTCPVDIEACLRCLAQPTGDGIIVGRPMTPSEFNRKWIQWQLEPSGSIDGDDSPSSTLAEEATLAIKDKVTVGQEGDNDDDEMPALVGPEDKKANSAEKKPVDGAIGVKKSCGCAAKAKLGQPGKVVAIHSISKQFHTHIMTHHDDICVQENTIEELESTVNNLILLMDDVNMTLYRRRKPADRYGYYWAPLIAAKTAFRVVNLDE